MNLLQKSIRHLAQLRKRALSDQHPDYATVQHLMRDMLGESSTNPWSYQTAASDFAQHPWVHKALKVWADSIGPLPIRVQRADGTLTADHELIDLLEHPNPTMTAGDLWREWAIHMGLGGECGFEFVKGAGSRFVELYPRGPQSFAVRPDPALRRYRRVAAYVLDPETAGVRDGRNDSRTYALPPDEFKHFKFFNPLNVWRGIAPMSALRLSVQIDELVQSWSSLFFKNAARPDFALIVPQGLTPQERTTLENTLSAKFTGPDGWHKPIVLENGVQDLKVFSHPRKDLEWLQERRFSRDEIGAVFGIPDEIMGYGRDTFENFETAERVLWTLTLTNLVGFRDDQLTHFFHLVGAHGRAPLQDGAPLRRDEKIVTDLSGVWVLRRARAVQYDDALKLFALGVPFNTIDARLGLGIGPVPGGDIPNISH
jgi:HK97 family phage portal protein